MTTNDTTTRRVTAHGASAERPQPHWNGAAWIQRVGTDWLMWDGAAWTSTSQTGDRGGVATTDAATHRVPEPQPDGTEAFWNGAAWIQRVGTDWLTWDGTTWVGTSATGGDRGGVAVTDAATDRGPEPRSDGSEPLWNGDAWIQRAGADWLMWDGTAWIRTGVADGPPAARPAVSPGPHPPVALGLVGATAVGIGGFLPFVNQYLEGEHLNYFKPGIGHPSAMFALLGLALFAEAWRRNSRLLLRFAGGLGALGLIGYVVFLIVGANGVTDSELFGATATWSPNVGVLVCLLGCAVMVASAARSYSHLSIPSDAHVDPKA